MGMGMGNLQGMGENHKPIPENLQCGGPALRYLPLVYGEIGMIGMWRIPVFIVVVIIIIIVYFRRIYAADVDTTNYANIDQREIALIRGLIVVAIRW